MFGKEHFWTSNPCRRLNKALVKPVWSLDTLLSCVSCFYSNWSSSVGLVMWNLRRNHLISFKVRCSYNVAFLFCWRFGLSSFLVLLSLDTWNISLFLLFNFSWSYFMLIRRSNFFRLFSFSSAHRWFLWVLWFSSLIAATPRALALSHLFAAVLEWVEQKRNTNLDH